MKIDHLKSNDHTGSGTPQTQHYYINMLQSYLVLCDTCMSFDEGAYDFFSLQECFGQGCFGTNWFLTTVGTSFALTLIQGGVHSTFPLGRVIRVHECVSGGCLST